MTGLTTTVPAPRAADGPAHAVAPSTGVASDADPVPQGHLGVLVIVCTATFFGVVSGSGVAVLLPEIGSDLGLGDGELSWVLSGFLLAYGVAIPFYGRLATRFGARRLFLLGVMVFALGSALAAAATGLVTLLVARTIQAVGGAAVPGLGMTLASRAYPEERRGFVLGVISATMGVAAAAGPLAAGIVSELADWRALFAVSVLAALTVPVGMRVLDPHEPTTREPLDLLGGAVFGVGCVGLLLAVTRGSQAGLRDGTAVVAAVIAAAAMLVFSLHQARTPTPYIPRTLLANRGYVVLALLGLLVTFANLAAQIGLPFLLSSIHDMSSLDIGVAVIPSALAAAVVGVVAGRLVDRIDAVGPMRLGLGLMAVGAVALSTFAGSSAAVVAILAAVFGAGFALVNTPIAAVVSRLVDPGDLASALSLCTMMIFIGGSFGSSLFTSIVINTPENGGAINPFHDGLGAGFSSAFAVLLVPIALCVALVRLVPRAEQTNR